MLTESWRPRLVPGQGLSRLVVREKTLEQVLEPAGLLTVALLLEPLRVRESGPLVLKLMPEKCQSSERKLGHP